MTLNGKNYLQRTKKNNSRGLLRGPRDQIKQHNGREDHPIPKNCP